MRTLRRFFKRLSSWATTQQDEERLRAEIEDHLALQTAENVRAGLSPVEARRQAVLKFGGVEAMKESYRDQRGLPLLETLIQDTRQALRRLRMAPAFTIATILTLALGIGATTSIFTLVHAVLLKSLPVANPGELYRLGKETRCCYLGGYSQDKRVLPCLVRSVQILQRQHQGFLRVGRLPGVCAAVWCPALGQPGRSRKLPGRVRLRQLLRRCSAYEPMPDARFTAQDDRARRSAGRRDELSLVAAKVWIGSVRDRQRLQSE